jgi:hypothetical protein
MARRKPDLASPSEEISIERGGITYKGTFQTERGMIRVSYRGHTKVTQLGGSAGTPAGLARLMLSELVRDSGDVGREN